MAHGVVSTLQTILITGASSGLGAALAEEYAVPGATLLLLGRSAERLRLVAETCRSRGATVVVEAVEVTDRTAMAERLAALDAATPVDLVIANAGISGGTGTVGGDGFTQPSMESEAQARQIFAVNVDGVLNTVHPLLGPMMARRRGHIALVSSLAGFRGFPGAPAYCASKAAVKVYGEALRGALRPHGLRVSVICPGFVRTPMTAANDYRMPFLMEAGRAARIIRRGLERRKARIAFPAPLAFGVWLAATLPPRLIDSFLRRLPAKAALVDAAQGHTDPAGNANKS